MIPFIRYKKRQTHRDRKWISGCQGLGGGAGAAANGYWVSLGRDVNVLKLDSGDVNILKTIELYTLKQ